MCRQFDSSQHHRNPLKISKLRNLRTTLRIKDARLCVISLYEQPYTIIARMGVKPRYDPKFPWHTSAFRSYFSLSIEELFPYPGEKKNYPRRNFSHGDDRFRFQARRPASIPVLKGSIAPSWTSSIRYPSSSRRTSFRVTGKGLSGTMP